MCYLYQNIHSIIRRINQNSSEETTITENETTEKTPQTKRKIKRLDIFRKNPNHKQTLQINTTIQITTELKKKKKKEKKVLY